MPLRMGTDPSDGTAIDDDRRARIPIVERDPPAAPGLIDTPRIRRILQGALQ
jgi:hypothetical protein